MNNLTARIVKLEERRRPVARVESKADRDNRVREWGGSLPPMMPIEPNRIAAIMAGMRADR